MPKFSHYKQLDSMDCDPTCLRMIAGFPWKQRHFVVVYSGFADDPGLLNAKMGIFIFFYHLARKTRNTLVNYTMKYRSVFIICISCIILGSCSHPKPKEYFVRPCEFVCDYPFNDTSKFVITCRVWGLLKYYHPNVTAGKLDWDQVLLDRLDKIHDARTSEQVNAELLRMIRIAGKYNYSQDKTWNDSLNMNVNLCWLDHSFINDTIRQELKKIASLTVGQPSVYTKIDHLNISAPNEKDYDNNVILDYKYRLLALFRYWNVIYYFYPYKYLMDRSWDETLSDFIPPFIDAYYYEPYYKAVQKMATRLNDGHAVLSVSSYRGDITQLYLTLIDTLTVVRTPPKGSLLERGDIILSLDGKNIRTVRDSLADLISSSNRHFTDNAINGYIYISVVDGCTLTVLRNRQEITICEDKKPLPERPSSPFHMISRDIGYVNLEALKSSDIPGMMDSLKNCRGIIFDLRNYPRKIYFPELFCYLSSKQEYCYGLATFADLSHCGTFYQHKCSIKYPDKVWHRGNKYKGKMTVLISAATMSAAETMAMSFRIHGATLIGTPTAGANGDVVDFFLPGGIKPRYSAIGFYYPDGEEMQRKGIIPDIEVYPTMDDIMAGRDEVLNAAIAYINSN